MSEPARKHQERMDIRLPAELKNKLARASALAGYSSLSEYVLRAAVSDADRVIGEHTARVLKDDVFDQFIAACDAADVPNAAMKKAVAKSRELGIDS